MKAPMSDHSPTASVRDGGTPDFEQIAVQFAAPAMALAMNVLGNRQDAEDACQEAFIQAFRNLERYEGRSGFQNWLYTILFRRCIDVIRKRKRTSRLYQKARLEQPLQAEDPIGGQAAARPVGEDILKALNPKERTALSLWANEGYTAEEISRVIHTSAGTVRVHLFHARKKLKAILERNHEALQNS